MDMTSLFSLEVKEEATIHITQNMKDHHGHQLKLNSTCCRLWIMIAVVCTRGLGISRHVPINTMLHQQQLIPTFDQKHQYLPMHENHEEHGDNKLSKSVTYQLQIPSRQQIDRATNNFPENDFVQSIDELTDSTEYTSSAAKATVTRILPLFLIISTMYYILLDETVEEDEDGIIMKKNTSDILLSNGTSDELLDGTMRKNNATDNFPTNASSINLQQIQTQPPIPTYTQEKDFQPMIPYDGIYIPHPPFGDENLDYRRICAPVGAASLLCMTLKYPFSFDVQDPTKSYPFPVDDRFYEINNQVTFIDGADLNECLSKKMDSKQCLDGFDPPNNNTIIGVWTRNPGSEPDNSKLYGVNSSPEQGNNLDRFFNESTFVVLGASPSPGIMMCMMRMLFGQCNGIGNKINSCKRKDRDIEHGRELIDIPEDSIVVAQHGMFNSTFCVCVCVCVRGFIPKLLKLTRTYLCIRLLSTWGQTRKTSLPTA
jgi:hypothetical protein